MFIFELFQFINMHVHIYCFPLGVQKQENGNLTPTESDRLLRSHMRLHVAAPNWSFVFDPAGRLCYYWSIIVSLAFLYNFWVIIYRFAFQEINREFFFQFLFPFRNNQWNDKIIIIIIIKAECATVKSSTHIGHSLRSAL